VLSPPLRLNELRATSTRRSLRGRHADRTMPSGDLTPQGSNCRGSASPAVPEITRMATFPGTARPSSSPCGPTVEAIARGGDHHVRLRCAALRRGRRRRRTVPDHRRGFPCVIMDGEGVHRPGLVRSLDTAGPHDPSFLKNFPGCFPGSLQRVFFAVSARSHTFRSSRRSEVAASVPSVRLVRTSSHVPKTIVRSW
jgi:hypothetical protein